MTQRPLELTVEALHASGDGVAFDRGRAVDVPGALPGERVRLTVQRDAPTVERLSDSPERVVPPCPIFERCGGCTLQHASATLQRDTRLTALRRALPAALREFPVTYVPSHSPLGWRSRARLAWESDRAGVRLGHRARRSKAVVPTLACPVLVPTLESALPALAEALGRVIGAGEVSLALGRGGAPVASIHVARGALDPRAYALGEALVASGFAGTALWAPEATVPFLTGDPTPVTLGGDGEALVLGLDGFAQAHGALNLLLAEAVVDAARPAGKKVLELYAGAGNFTVALARRATAVVAVESDTGATRALRENLRARSLENVTVRDEPAEQCATVRADVVVLDPPRTGARTVCEALAAKPIAKTVVYVSCDPATLGRDLGTLLARYELRSLTAFEMFPHTGHIEVVAGLALTSSRPR